MEKAVFYRTHQHLLTHSSLSTENHWLMDRDKERKVSARDGIPPFLLILKVKIFHAHTQDLSESWLLGCSFGTASVLLPPSLPPSLLIPPLLLRKGGKKDPWPVLPSLPALAGFLKWVSSTASGIHIHQCHTEAYCPPTDPVKYCILSSLWPPNASVI